MINNYNQIESMSEYASNILKRSVGFMEQIKDRCPIDKIKTVLDIGSNIGIYTVLFADLFKNSVVYSFEPDNKLYSRLEYVVNGYNEKDRIIVKNYGFWKTSGKFPLGYPANMRSTPGSLSLFGKQKSRKCRFKVLKNVVKRLSISPDFIKIDTEGSEAAIMLSSPDVFSKCKWLYIEINTSFPSSRKLPDIISKLGFKKVLDLTKYDSLWENICLI